MYELLFFAVRAGLYHLSGAKRDVSTGKVISDIAHRIIKLITFVYKLILAQVCYTT